VIHDHRIEHRGRVAQIDHLLINRFLDIFVLESKNYDYGVKISEEGGLFGVGKPIKPFSSSPVPAGSLVPDLLPGSLWDARRRKLIGAEK
jgi:hypothetical protein